MDFLFILWRAVFSVLVLFLLTKLMGFRQISQLSFYDYIIGISIGSIAADMASDLQTDLIYTLVPMTIYALISVGISYWTTKSIKARRILSGTSIVLIQNGKILRDGLKQARYDVNDLLAECRSCGYFDINDLLIGVMEHTGKISFLPKEDKRPVNPSDLNLTPPKEGMVANLVIDGQIMKKHLKAVGKEEQWLHKQLSAQGVTDVKRVLLATCDVNDQFNVYTKETPKPVHVFE